MIVAFLIAFFLVFIVSDLIINKRPIELTMKKREAKAIEIEDYIKSNLKETPINEENLKALVNVGETNKLDLYMVDSKGNILYGTNNNIKTIDLTNLRERNIYEYGRGLNKKMFKGQGVIKIDDNHYVFYDYIAYTEKDMSIMIMLLISGIIIFFILIFGRVSYISKMNNSIKVIAGGNLSQRVPVKYKNELTELAEDINFMASELENEDIKKREFITNISHDLRTPLTTVLGYLKIIEEEKYSSTEELKGYLGIINRKSLYLKNLLDDFFDYSKLSSKDINLNFTNIYAQEILRQIFFEEKERFSQKDLELKLNLPETPYYLKGDGELLERAINNLLSNAYKYSQKESTVEIKFDIKEINNLSYGVIEVINIAEGTITKEEASKIFERLYKRDESRGTEGSGLGLSITKEIMTLHNGYINTELKEQALIVSLIIPVY